MRYFYQLIATILIVASTNLSAQTYDAYYDGIVTNVSSASILADLTTFENFGIKSISTTAQANTKDWIVSRYQSLGYTDIVLQPFSHSGGITNNIIVTKTGTVYPNTFLIIDAHYDTINGPGTNDNGSGTVLLLELARLLKGIDTEYSIKFIHFSGEEQGLFGSNYYVTNTVIPNNLDIKLVLNIDQVGGTNGTTNDTIVCERDTGEPTSNNAASAIATSSLATCFNLYSNLNTEFSHAYASDYMPFENNGEIITGLYESNETPYSHTSNDLLVNMDPAYLVEVTKGALGAALFFSVAVQDTSSVADSSFNNAIQLSPNPSSGVFSIAYKTSILDALDVRIVNVIGKEVHYTSVNQNTNSLDLGFLAKGVYFCAFSNADMHIVKKIIIN